VCVCVCVYGKMVYSMILHNLWFDFLNAELDQDCFDGLDGLAQPHCGANDSWCRFQVLIPLVIWNVVLRFCNTIVQQKRSFFCYALALVYFSVYFWVLVLGINLNIKLWFTYIVQNIFASGLLTKCAQFLQMKNSIFIPNHLVIIHLWKCNWGCMNF